MSTKNQNPLPPANPSEAASVSGMSPRETSADKLFKTAFGMFPRSLVELIRPRLAARLDLDHARTLEAAQLPDFRKAGHRTPDLVIEAKTLSGEPQLVVVHIEAEDKFGKKIDERMMEYGLLLYLKTKKTVISIAVFLSGGKAGVTVREVFARTGEEAGEEEWEAIRFRYLAWGLSKSLAEDHVDLPQPLAPALASLMRSKKWDKPKQRFRCMKAIRRLVGLEISRRYVLGRIVDKYLPLSDDEERRYTAELRRESNKEIHQMITTWEEALAASKTEGESQGILKATRRAILLLAKSCHRDIPSGFEESLETIDDLDQLDRILEKIPHVNSLSELELD